MHLTRRKRPEPSAFAPAVGVKTPHQTQQSITSKPHPLPPSNSPTALKKAFVHFLSGGLAAGLVRASLQPLDTCKTRLQAQAVRHLPLRSVLLAEGGLPGLYRGVIPGILGIVPAAAVYMLTFQTLKSRLTGRFPRSRNVAIALAAGLGDVAASLVRVPCEVMKQRLQVGVYLDVGQAVREVAKSQRGLVGLYTGLPAQLARDVPYAAVEFVFYENLKALVKGRRERLSKVESFLVGGASGAAAAVMSNPMDVVKTRIMTQVRGAGVYRSVGHAVVKVAREEGVSAFAKGIAPRIAAKTLQSAMFFAAYEALKKSFARLLDVQMSAKGV